MTRSLSIRFSPGKQSGVNIEIEDLINYFKSHGEGQDWEQGECQGQGRTDCGEEICDQRTIQSYQCPVLGECEEQGRAEEHSCSGRIYHSLVATDTTHSSQLYSAPVIVFA